MTLTPWIPKETWWDSFYDLKKVEDNMKKIFNSFSSDTGRNIGLLEGNWAPAIDIYDSNDNLMIRADIPGMEKKDIEVIIHGDTLIIKGEKKIEKNVKEDDYIRAERFYGNFNRSFTIPVLVDQNKVNATYKNGVLELILPKKEEEKPKQITVNIK